MSKKLDLGFLNSGMGNVGTMMPQNHQRPQQHQGFDPDLLGLIKMFGSGATRHTMGGQLEDPNAPTGLDWLNAHSSGGHSWEQPQHQESHRGRDLALEHDFMDQQQNGTQKISGPQGQAIQSKYGVATNALKPLYANSAMPITGLDPTNPLTRGERGQVGQNVHNSFNDILAAPLPNMGFGQVIKNAQQRPMSNEGKIPNANFDLLNGQPDAPMQKPNRSVAPVAPLMQEPPQQMPQAAPLGQQPHKPMDAQQIDDLSSVALSGDNPGLLPYIGRGLGMGAAALSDSLGNMFTRSGEPSYQNSEQFLRWLMQNRWQNQSPLYQQ